MSPDSPRPLLRAARRQRTSVSLRIGLDNSKSASPRRYAASAVAARAIDDAHPAAPDLVQNLIVAEPPIGDRAHRSQTASVFQRFIIRSIGPDPDRADTTQAKAPCKC